MRNLSWKKAPWLMLAGLAAVATVVLLFRSQPLQDSPGPRSERHSSSPSDTPKTTRAAYPLLQAAKDAISEKDYGRALAHLDAVERLSGRNAYDSFLT